MEEVKKCDNCEWYAQIECVCTNGDSEHRGDFTDRSYVCEEWEEKWK
jgi:primase-polymerase (primpol)-like protein